MLQFGLYFIAMPTFNLPVCDICQEVLFEKPAPLLHCVKEADFKELDIHPKPSIENSEIFKLGNFSMQILKIIYL